MVWLCFELFERESQNSSESTFDRWRLSLVSNVIWHDPLYDISTSIQRPFSSTEGSDAWWIFGKAEPKLMSFTVNSVRKEGS